MVTLQLLKQKGKKVPKSFCFCVTTFWYFFTFLSQYFHPFLCFSVFELKFIIQTETLPASAKKVLLLVRSIVPPNDPIIERMPILTPVCHSF